MDSGKVLAKASRSSKSGVKLNHTLLFNTGEVTQPPCKWLNAPVNGFF